jgi:hypothetical protein
VTNGGEIGSDIGAHSDNRIKAQARHGSQGCPRSPAVANCSASLALSRTAPMPKNS